MFTRKFT